MPSDRTASAVGRRGLLWAIMLFLIACGSLNQASVCTGDPEFDLWVSNLEGTVTQLTDLPGAEAFPDWSPDGDRIAFVAGQDGNCEIHLLSHDGSGLVNLTNTNSDELYPSWSPDGTEIAYSSGGQLQVMDVDSGEVRQLTDSKLTHAFPDWSPDGRSIVFSGGSEPAGPGAVHDIYVIPASGGEETPLTNGERLLVAPRWSRDGSRIAFFDHTDTLTVWSMEADGSNAVALGPGGHGSWGPDRDSFLHDQQVDDGDVDLYLMNPAGAEAVLFVDGPGIDTTPAWSPNGQMVVFSSDRPR